MNTVNEIINDPDDVYKEKLINELQNNSALIEGIKALDKSIKKYTERKNFLMEIEELPMGIDVDVGYSALIVNTLDEVYKLRKYLMEKVGWRDKFSMIWYSSPYMMAEWESNKPYDIWLKTSPEDFPDELQSEKCKVVKKKEIIPEQSYITYSYECKEEET